MIKPNTIQREYSEINGFELRIGKFADPNEKFNGTKMEIRILKRIETEEDASLFDALKEKIKEYLL